MRQHNGTILVTEPISIIQYTLPASIQSLPFLPTGDVGQQILQVTLRSADEAWEWSFNGIGDYFFMAPLDIVVLPVRDRRALEAFVFRADTNPADMRIIYEA
jgi:hypothetical protein